MKSRFTGTGIILLATLVSPILVGITWGLAAGIGAGVTITFLGIGLVSLIWRY